MGFPQLPERSEETSIQKNRRENELKLPRCRGLSIVSSYNMLILWQSKIRRFLREERSFDQNS